MCRDGRHYLRKLGNTQRIYGVRDNSPSRLLLCVDTEWACEGGTVGVGAARKVRFGLKAQFGCKEVEQSTADASPSALINVIADTSAGNDVAPGSFPGDDGDGSRRSEHQWCSEYDRVEGMTAKLLNAAKNVDVTAPFEDGDVRCVALERVEGAANKLLAVAS